MALIGSQPVSWAYILRWRLAVRMAIAIVVTLGASILTLAALGALAPVSVWGMGLWTAAVLALALFWTGVALLINAAGRSSATNSAALLVVWLLLVVVVPALIGELSQTIAPVASRYS